MVLTFDIQNQMRLQLAEDPAIGLQAPELTVGVLVEGQAQFGARRYQTPHDRHTAVFCHLLGGKEDTVRQWLHTQVLL